jgi:ribosomal protein L11 methyltransferase
LEIAVQASHEASEAAYAVMSRYAPGRVAIEEPVVQPADGDGAEIDYSQPVTLRAYVPIDGAEASTRQSMEEALYLLSRIDIEGVGEVTARELAEEDWANAWKEHYHTRKVGRRLVIKPSWLDYDEGPDEVVVELDPGMAFGTGLHPTTDTCLQLLEDLVHGGERVLDLGAGSGILSLAAIGLGAASVLALDVEPIAVDTCRANCAHVPAITVAPGSLPLPRGTGSCIPQTFDLVLANIIARVLVELAAELKACLRPGAKLLASGIIDQREAEVAAAFEQAGLHIERRVQSGDWVTLVAS